MSREESRLRKKFPKGLTAPQLGLMLGLSGRTVARRMDAGALPFSDHGTWKRVVAWTTIDLVIRYGLGGVARMREAGKL